MRGKCIDTGATTTLQKGKEYFLFEHGPNNYLVSNFNRPTAHMGSYQKAYFEIVKEQDIGPGLHEAIILENYKGYGLEVGKKVVVKKSFFSPSKSYYFYDYETGKPKGCMPKHIFNVLGPFEKGFISIETVEVVEDEPKESEQLNLFDLLEG